MPYDGPKTPEVSTDNGTRSPEVMSVPFRSLAAVTPFERYRVSLCESCESDLIVRSILLDLSTH